MDASTIATLTKCTFDLLRAQGPHMAKIHRYLQRCYKSQYPTAQPTYSHYTLALSTPPADRTYSQKNLIREWETVRKDECYLLRKIDDCSDAAREARRLKAILVSATQGSHMMSLEDLEALFQRCMCFLMRSRHLVLETLERPQEDSEEVEKMTAQLRCTDEHRRWASTRDYVLSFAECLLFLYDKSLSNLHARNEAVVEEREAIFEHLDERYVDEFADEDEETYEWRRDAQEDLAESWKEIEERNKVHKAAEDCVKDLKTVQKRWREGL